MMYATHISMNDHTQCKDSNTDEYVIALSALLCYGNRYATLPTRQ